MPRGRDIKPGFFISDELAEVSRDCRLLFIGLWTIADREGRLELRPARIKAQVFPYDADVTPQTIEDMLTLLSTCRGRFLELYEVTGCRYVLIRNFKKHQHIHPNEKPSAYPGPTCVPVNSGKATTQSGNSAIPSSLLPFSVCVSGSSPPLPASDQSKTHARPSGRDLVEAFGQERARVWPSCFPWVTAKNKAGDAESFAASLPDDIEPTEVVATMRAFFAHVKAGHDGWSNPSNTTDPSFAFGTWKSKFTALLEELHGCAPKAAKTRKPGEMGEVKWR